MSKAIKVSRGDCFANETVCAFRDVLSSHTPMCSIHQGDFFYVVESGQVSFVDGAEIVGSCTDGGSFGELALL